MSTAKDELRSAAFLLRNPIRRPELCGVADLALAEPLIELLETAAEYISPDAIAHPTHVVRALSVARAINGADQ